MQLSKQYIKAVVDTLELEHQKKYPPKDDTDGQGVTKAQEAAIKAKAKRIRSAFSKLPKELKDYLKDYESPINHEGKLDDESEFYDNLKETFVYELEKKANFKGAGKGKKDPSIFDRTEMERKVTMAALDSKNLDELGKKLGVNLKK
jgi:hypothetical protein